MVRVCPGVAQVVRGLRIAGDQAVLVIHVNMASPHQASGTPTLTASRSKIRIVSAAPPSVCLRGTGHLRPGVGDAAHDAR